MTELEDRLRRELHELRPRADSIRPLRVPQPRRFAWARRWLIPAAADVAPARSPDGVRTAAAELAGRPGRVRRARWPRLVAPLAAAAAVIVVAALAVGVGGHPRTPAPRGRGPASPFILGVPPPSSYGLPTYYIGMLDPQSGGFGQQTLIGNLTTGSRYHIRQPRGQNFTVVAAAANDRTFVALAQPLEPPTQSNSSVSGTLYLAHLDVADNAVRLTRLRVPIPAQFGLTRLNGLAVAPDGSAIAVSTTTGLPLTATQRTTYTSRLKIYSLTGRLIREWTSPGSIDGGSGISTEGNLDWAWNGELAFRWSMTWSESGRGAGIWVLNTSARSGSLLGSSRLVVSYQQAHKFTADKGFAISGNGEYVDAQIDANVNPLKTQHHIVSWLGAFSTATGRLVSEVWPVEIPLGEQIYWSSYSGSQMIVQAPLARDRWAFGVLTDGKFAALPRFPEAFWAGESF
jgi:hypothetical protein